MAYDESVQAGKLIPLETVRTVKSSQKNKKRERRQPRKEKKRQRQQDQVELSTDLQIPQTAVPTSYTDDDVEPEHPHVDILVR